MIILGIDPGYATIGYGVVAYENPRFTTLDYGVLTTPAHLTPQYRLKLLWEGLNTLIDTYRQAEMAVFRTPSRTAVWPMIYRMYTKTMHLQRSSKVKRCR